jgi:transcriptional regulator with XRE-family HTH domain
MHDKLAALPTPDPPIASSIVPSTASATEESPPVPVDLARLVGENLKRMRTKRGLSLQRLSRASRVSRAMLSQIELGRSSPTVNVVWKIAQALGVSVTALLSDARESQSTVLRAAAAKLLTSHDGAFSSRALAPADVAANVEFYEMRLAPAATEKADPYPPGTKENLVVADGTLRIVIGGKAHRLETGDAIVFDADNPHAYCNDGPGSLRLYVVVTYERGAAHGPARRELREV